VVDRLAARWKEITLPWRMLLMFFLFELIAGGRVFVEMQVLTRNDSLMTAVHRLLWYTYVFLFFAACYRRILNAPFEKLMCLSVGGVILFIPPIYAALSGQEFLMNYLVSREPLEIARELLTLHYNHPKNYFMFPELLVLLLGTVSISWYFSRHVPKALLNTVVAFYGAFLTAGLCWFSVEPKHDAVFRLQAMFHAQQFYAFQFLSGIVVLSVLLFLPEVIAWGRRLSARSWVLSVLLVIFCYLFVLFIIAPRHDRPLAVADLTILFLPIIGTSVTPLIVADRGLPQAVKVYAGWFAFFALALFLGVFWEPASMVIRR